MAPESSFTPLNRGSAPRAADTAADALADISLASLSHIFLRRLPTILVVLLFSLLVGIFLATRPKHYEASGALQVRNGSSNQFKVDTAALTGDLDTDNKTESEVQILQSQSLYTSVARELNLASNPAVVGKKNVTTKSVDDPFVQARVIAAMRQMIRIERVPKTQIINVYCSTTVPLLSEDIANSLINQYIERVFKTRLGSTDRASKFMTQQLEDLRNKITHDQQQLVDYQGRLGVVGFDDTHNLITDQLEQLAKANEQADIERIVAEARYRILEDERPDLLEGGPPLLSASGTSNPTSLLQSLRATQDDLQNQFASLNAQFGPNYPEVKRLKARLAEATKQVNAEQNRVLEQAKTAYGAALQNQNMTSAALEARKKQAFQLRSDMVNYQILLHDYQSSRTLYEGLMQRLREAGVVAGLESADIDVVDLATLPVAPTGIDGFGYIGLSLGIGLVLAGLLALLLEGLDTTVHSVDELERYIDLPALAILPSFTFAPKKNNRRTASASEETFMPDFRPEVLRSPQSHFTEGIQLLRSSLLLANPGQRPKSIIFTSSVPREGKSTVCGNLACMLAMNNESVLLVDADLRRPSVHTKFNITNTVGLSNVLSGAMRTEDVVQKFDEVPSLRIITSGPVPPKPGALLASEWMRNFVLKACEEYSFVLIDMPPALAISDATILAEMVDATILVVRDGGVNKKTLRRLHDVLVRVGARIPGFVFNGVNKNSTEYYEYKGQYGYSKYGYLQDDDE